MEKQITIIIPTYNMEAYIGKCLDSLIIPEFDQVEVLVVNDGSKDRSSEIAHSYADRYPRSIRVIDKPNGNYGSCINAALPQATGRYIKILDADDTFDTEAFSRLVRKLSETNVDMVLTPYITVNQYGEAIKRSDFLIQAGKTFSSDDVVELLSERLLQMHEIAYKRDVFNGLQYRQTEGISYTDTEWVYFPIRNVKNGIYLDYVVYRYLSGREGQTMNFSVLIKNIDHLMQIIRRLVADFDEYEGVWRQFLEKYITSRIRSIYWNCLVEAYPKANDKLVVFDSFICSRTTNWGKIVYSKSMNFHNLFNLKYVEYWKRYNRSKYAPLLLLRQVLVRLHKIMHK